MELLHSPSYSTGKGPQHAAVIVSSLILAAWERAARIQTLSFTTDRLHNGPQNPTDELDRSSCPCHVLTPV